MYVNYIMTTFGETILPKCLKIVSSTYIERHYNKGVNENILIVCYVRMLLKAVFSLLHDAFFSNNFKQRYIFAFKTGYYVFCSFTLTLCMTQKLKILTCWWFIICCIILSAKFVTWMQLIKLIFRLISGAIQFLWFILSLPIIIALHQIVFVFLGCIPNDSLSFCSILYFFYIMSFHIIYLS